MDPHTIFCPNPACPATGQIGEDDVEIHSRQPKRYRCDVCRKGTPLYRPSAFPDRTVVKRLV
jgi:hypothetical protein